jgi:hypothetical protein
MLHKGEMLVRIVSALITLGMAGCLFLFARENVLPVAIVASYAVAVVACAVFATSWPWRGTSKARFYALLGVLWTSAAASAWFSGQTMTATLFGVAAALSFWSSLTIMSLHGNSHSSQVGHAQQAK